MKNCDVIIYTCKCSKFSEITSKLFNRLTNTLYDVNLSTLLSKTWFESSKYLLINSPDYEENHKDELQKLVEDTLSVGQHRMLITSDWLKDSLLSLKRFPLESVKDSIWQIRENDISRMLLFENLETLQSNLDWVKLEWNLESENQSDEVNPIHSNMIAIGKSKMDLSRFLNNIVEKSTQFDYEGEHFSINKPTNNDVALPNDKCEKCSDLFVLLTEHSLNSQSYCICSSIYQFDRKGYFDNLSTKYIGNVVLYGDIVASSYTLMNSMLPMLDHCDTLTIISRYQTKGVGRASNKWLSPFGCAMFTCMLKFKSTCRVTTALTLIQHIMAVSIVQAINTLTGLQRGEITIKWPNDIYTRKSGKLGGIVCKSSCSSNVTCCTIGCGVNISNRKPTICLYDVLDDVNESYANKLNYPSMDSYIALTLTNFEKHLNLIETQSNGIESFKEIYHKIWMHGNQPVNFINKTEEKSGTICGIDEYGYLVVESNNETITLHPDGNSFDMMKNLISPK